MQKIEAVRCASALKSKAGTHLSLLFFFLLLTRDRLGRGTAACIGIVGIT